ncbi:MAG: adenylate/guanylate cyclase domain-containing protein [Chloroflexi bacterium]|nr:adenylate/guanylate cyclase domain-containing protein [Chloroflexota bacterium]
MTPPETKFAQSGDASIAYQVLGQGPLDLVFVPGFVSHVEYAWEDPAYARFLERLASFSRLILFDKRGTGLSDRITGIPTLEQRMDDVRAVMDAVGSQRAALFGVSEGGSMSVLFAATYPERASALVLYGIIAKGWLVDDASGALTRKQDEASDDKWRKGWGGPINIEYMAPSVAHDERFRQWWAKFLRLSAGPTTVINLLRMYGQIDVSAILPSVHIPTLVLHRTADLAIEVEQGRYLAEHIPGAKLVELAGEDHFWWVGDSEAIVNEIEEFLTGKQQTMEPDRVLATVLFTDIVDSTRRAAEMGDHHWRDLLGAHNAMLSKEINRFRGRLIKSTGDGCLATFDGPARAIRCALALSDESRRMGLEIRAGLHTGEIELIEQDIGGLAVHIAARVLAQAQANEVWLSRTVKDLVVGSGFEFSERGDFSLKGIPGEWRLFTVQR